MKKANAVKVIMAVILLGVAAFLLVGFFRDKGGISEKTYFYDLSEQKLFAVSREEVPPIRGLNDPTEDAVRAVVVSTSGNPNDKQSRKIAYLEKYSPELKQHLEKVRKGEAEAMPRGTRDQHRFVKRVQETKWHAVNTPEGQKIMNEWNVPGPDGKYPVVCVP